MKRLFFTALVVTALLALTAGTAFAGSALELYKVQNNGGGPTFTFRVNGEFSDSELSSGFVQVQGGDPFPLYCAQTAPDTVVCHASKKTGGHDVVVGFGGARFWVFVPESRVKSYCDPIFDWNDPPFGPFDHWQQFGVNCSEEAPYDGQNIFFELLDLGTYEYFYYSSGNTNGFGGATWTPAGPGYYYP